MLQNLKEAWNDLFSSLTSWRWTVIKTLANLFFSELGLSVIQYLADYSLFYTRTQSVGSMVTKIAVFQLFNSFAVPLAAFSFDHWMNNLLSGVQGSSVGRRLWCENNLLHVPSVLPRLPDSTNRADSMQFCTFQGSIHRIKLSI